MSPRTRKNSASPPTRSIVSGELDCADTAAWALAKLGLGFGLGLVTRADVGGFFLGFAGFCTRAGAWRAGAGGGVMTASWT